jgi:uncharacterized membrane protein YidH (DUF202 family)
MGRTETNEQEIARIGLANEIGLAYLKTLILLNSGSVVVLMTHMGTAKADAAFRFSLDAIKNSMLAFLFGMASILIAVIISYVYTSLNHQAKLKTWLDSWIIPFNASLGLFSLISFITGVAKLICSVSAA